MNFVSHVARYLVALLLVIATTIAHASPALPCGEVCAEHVADGCDDGAGEHDSTEDEGSCQDACGCCPVRTAVIPLAAIAKLASVTVADAVPAPSAPALSADPAELFQPPRA